MTSIHYYFLTVLPPIIETQPNSTSAQAGRTVTFSVVASGVGLTYQWFGPGGVALSDVPQEIAGARTPTLQIFNIQLDDEGTYQVRVSNAGGSVSSQFIILRIGKCINIFLHSFKQLLYTVRIFFHS